MTEGYYRDHWLIGVLFAFAIIFIVVISVFITSLDNVNYNIVYGLGIVTGGFLLSIGRFVTAKEKPFISN